MEAFNPQTLMKFQILFDGGLAILALLGRMQRPATVREVARLCGIAEHTASRHLQRLYDLGLVHRDAPGENRGYCLAPGALDGLLPEQGVGIDTDSDPDPDPDVRPDSEVHPDSDVRPNSDLQPDSDLPPDSDISPDSGSRPDQEIRLVPGDVKFNHLPFVVVNTQANQKDRIKLTTTKTTTNALVSNKAPPDDPEWQRNREALRQRGIIEPKRSELAHLPGMTPEFIRAWELHLQAASGREVSPGLLIHVLAQGEPPPEAPDPDHPPDCACKLCLLGSFLCPDCLELPCICPEGA